jgi:hypothetical protein
MVAGADHIQSACTSRPCERTAAVVLLVKRFLLATIIACAQVRTKHPRQLRLEETTCERGTRRRYVSTDLGTSNDGRQQMMSGDLATGGVRSCKRVAEDDLGTSVVKVALHSAIRHLGGHRLGYTPVVAVAARSTGNDISHN